MKCEPELLMRMFRPNLSTCQGLRIALNRFQEKIYNDSRVNVMGPQFGKVDSSVLQRLIQLTNSPDVGDKLAGITAIE